MPSQYLALVVQNVDNTQREQLQAAVKHHSEEWWHEFLNVWIFRTDDSARQWQDRIAIIFGAGGTQFLILTLKDTTRWEDVGALANKTTRDWLEQSFTGRQPAIEPPCE